MRRLVRLITPRGGIVLDPFTGSGSTGKACMLEGFAFVGIEQNAEYLQIARARIEAATLPLLRAIDDTEPDEPPPPAQTSLWD
jgi:site-specific DNA-methyltransferase (adenine-specific)